MKKTAKITLCGMIIALSVVFMLVSYFPYFTYAAPAVTGLLLMVIVIELNVKWGFISYLAACPLIFIFAETEAKLLYICFFGYYPVLKAVVEKIKLKPLKWVVKISIFNAAMLLIYLILSFVFDISLSDFEILGKYGALLFLAAGNGVFVIYDIAISRMSIFYIVRFHKVISKLLK